MKCREVKKALVAYQDGEVMRRSASSSTPTWPAVQLCERELVAVGSGRRRLAESLKSAAAQALLRHRRGVGCRRRSPKWRRAWCAHAPPDSPVTSQRRPPHELRWRVALGTPRRGAGRGRDRRSAQFAGCGGRFLRRRVQHPLRPAGDAGYCPRASRRKRSLRWAQDRSAPG